MVVAFAGVILASCGPSEPSITLDAFAGSPSYATRFAAAENPLSDGGKWLSARAASLDWADVAAEAGLAHGTQRGGHGYDDSTALLAGTWTADQMAQATVRCATARDDAYEEVELRLRSALAPHALTGYEINFRCSKTAKAYSEIVRWNGPLGKFTYLTRGEGSKYGVATGDTVAATAVGEVLTAYINGVPMLQATDRTFATGSPGIGFFLEGAAGAGRYGFTSFIAANAPSGRAP
jgi:hypothetical protein